MKGTSKKKWQLFAAAFALVILIGVIAVMLIKFYPNNTVEPLDQYYDVSDSELLLIMQNQVAEQRGIYLDGEPYVDLDTVKEYFNKRFYFDKNENLLIYSTPTTVMKAQVGDKAYYENKSKVETGYQIVKVQGEKVYVAMDYVKQFSNVEYAYYENPNRLVIEYQWGESFLYATVKKKAAVRTKDTVKAPILKELKPDDKVMIITGNETVEKGFSKVLTKDGVVGYMKTRKLNEGAYEKLESDFKEEAYSHITKDYTICMVWHQVTNMAANEGLLNLLSKTKGVTTVSPTWYEVTSEKGSISSLASETYVKRAHDQGVEVWALCSDFNKDVEIEKVLGTTSSREKLENNLVAQAIQYDLDGLNIDFETIPAEAGEDYIQFIRELSVKCRNNGIVLSVDSYVPTAYSEYYDREEQAAVADYVVIMGYDEHYAGSKEAGSVSSLSFVEDAVKNTLAQVPADQIIMGIPFYTRLWTEKKDGSLSSSACSMSQGEAYLSANGVSPKWDDATGQYYGEYKTDNGLNRIWLEEEKSIKKKLDVISKSKLGGISCWKLGLEKESVWDVILKAVN
ncbi:MAG: glycosyl hydrolase family 18 protein [Clostridiales bacterium]|nr:glycosyl hydrolase family 18 protein [Clostridiales bacterium]